jgi:serine/threonine-protein kinase HipA
MGLDLVGETIDAARAHYAASTGKLIPLIRGVYVDKADDIDATVLKHAIRIARYLYPKAYLSAASAALLRPTVDGRLFLSGTRKQRRRIRALEIIVNEAPAHPSTKTAIVDDGMGELTVSVSSIRQRVLEAFRIRSEHAASIDDTMRAEFAGRLVEEYKTPQLAADALWALARENGWHKEAELAERFLLRKSVVIPIENQAAISLIVAWHGVPIGNLRHDGFEWRWTPDPGAAPPIIRPTNPGQLPPFIVSLLPEGWLEAVLRNQDERALLRSGKRYMSNITIVENAQDLAITVPDVLRARLRTFMAEGVFTGHYAGPGRSEIEEDFERNLAQIYDSDDTPRLSGVQIKAPMFLDADGALAPSIGKPFTHILKPAGTSGYDGLPLVEWLDMALGREAGLNVPDTALVPMPQGMPAALLVERFDIRDSVEDSRLIAFEDMCSVLDLPSKDKYQGTMERIARAVRPLSTAPEEDLIIILRRALFAWLVGDGDMHLKNMALLKIGMARETHFRDVRIAPLYDAVTTRVFPRLKDDHMALKINGKDDRIKRRDFHQFAATAGIRQADADAAINEMLARLKRATDTIRLPRSIDCGPQGAALAQQVLDICRSRMRALDG